MLLFPVSSFALPRVPFSASVVGQDPLKRVLHLCPDLPRPTLDLWARYDNEGHRSNAETRLVRLIGRRKENPSRADKHGTLDSLFLIMSMIYPGLREWNHDPDGGILWFPGDESACEEMDAGAFGVLYFKGTLHVFLYENTALTSLPYAKEYLGVPLINRVWWHVLGGGGYRIEPLGRVLRHAFKGPSQQLFWRVEAGLGAPFGAAHSRLGILVLDPFFALRKAGLGPHGRGMIHAVLDAIRACETGEGVGAPWGSEETVIQTHGILHEGKNRQKTDEPKNRDWSFADRRKSENRQEKDVNHANGDSLKRETEGLETLEKQYKTALEEGDIETADKIMREMGVAIKRGARAG